MNRISALARPFALLWLAGNISLAQQSGDTPTGGTEALKQAIEKQGKQIDALAQQVAELNRRLAAQKDDNLNTSAKSPPAPSAEVSPAPAPAPSPSDSSKAEPAQSDGTKHTVAKGETLTSIAKRYNIPLPELEKANKIENDRKLQIGQVLNLPATSTKPSEAPTEISKENP